MSRRFCGLFGGIRSTPVTVLKPGDLDGEKSREARKDGKPETGQRREDTKGVSPVEEPNQTEVKKISN